MTASHTAVSMICMCVEWFRGSSSNISLWLTPAIPHPRTLIDSRKIRMMQSMGPRYKRVTIVQSLRYLYLSLQESKSSLSGQSLSCYLCVMLEMLSSVIFVVLAWCITTPEAINAANRPKKQPPPKPTSKVVQSVFWIPNGGTWNARILYFHSNCGI